MFVPSHQNVFESGKRHCRDPVVESIRLVNGRNDIRGIRADCVKCAVGALCHGGSGGSLALDGDGLPLPCHDEIHLRSARRPVEGDVGVGIEPPDIRQDHLFPASAECRMCVEFVERLDSQKGARKTCVADIDLGRLHKTLAKVGRKRML